MRRCWDTTCHYTFACIDAYFENTFEAAGVLLFAPVLILYEAQKLGNPEMQIVPGCDVGGLCWRCFLSTQRRFASGLGAPIPEGFC